MASGVTLKNVNGGTVSLQYSGTDVGNKVITVPERAFTVGELDSIYSMSADDINLSNGKIFTKTISGNTTLTISGMRALPDANTFVLQLTNGGSAVITWFSGVKWSSGVAPILTASGIDILSFYSNDGGTTWRGSVFSKDNR